MAKKKSKSPERRAAQKIRTANNKKKAWEKHLNTNPKDTTNKNKIESLLKVK